MSGRSTASLDDFSIVRSFYFLVIKLLVFPSFKIIPYNVNSKLLSHRLTRLSHVVCTYSCAVGKNEVPFSIAIGKELLKVFSETLVHGNSKNEVR